MILSDRQARLLRELDIVLVDDNRALIGIVSKVLHSLGIASLRTASDGTAGLSLLKDWPANLVLTDLNMQPMNGLSFTRKIRSGDGGIDPRTPVIALTGNTETETIKAALLAGVNGIMVKPIEPQAMVNRIEKVIFSRVVYQLNGDVYVANPKAEGTLDTDLIYDGLLPQVKASDGKTVEKEPDPSQEDDAWVLD